jgi:hypothetical protein
MKSLYAVALAMASALALADTAQATVITNLSVDPTSATGSFNHSLGSSTVAFDDQYTFTLDHALTLTIASVTNVFPSPTDFIKNFTGTVFDDPDGIIGNGDDTPVIGPVLATLGCGVVAKCQGMAGSAVLDAGNYYLDISGTASGSSGYGGNIATFAAPVPLPAASPLLGGALAGLGFLGRYRRQRTV